jgi:hypothetical protein
VLPLPLGDPEALGLLLPRALLEAEADSRPLGVTDTEPLELLHREADAETLRTLLRLRLAEEVREALEEAEGGTLLPEAPELTEREAVADTD